MNDEHDPGREYEELDRVSTMAVPPSAEQRSGGRRLAVVGFVAAAFVAMLALPRVFGIWVDPPDENVFVETTTTTSTIPPGTKVVVDTELGPWTWTKIDVEDPWSVVGYSGRLWAIDSSSTLGTSSGPESRLVVSDDGVSWERVPLPTDDKGYFYLQVVDDRLLLTGILDIDNDRRVWTSSDGTTWQETTMPIPGPASLLNVSLTEGFEATGLYVDPYVEERVEVGDVVLLSGTLTLQPSSLIPQLDEVFRMAETRMNTDGTAYTVVGVEDGTGERNETVLEQHGTSVDFVFWRGRADEGTVVHTASLTTPDMVTAKRIVLAGGISTEIPLTWRSSDGGASFTVVADPFAPAISEDADSRHGARHLEARDGQFIAYGRVPIGQEIRISPYEVRDASTSIGAVATSEDGLAWTITRIPELVSPLAFVEFGEATIAAGTEGLWVFDDATGGEFVPLTGAEQMSGTTDRYVVISGPGLLDISTDGRTWTEVPYPDRSGVALTSGVHAAPQGNAVVFVDFGRESVNAVWVGDLG